MKQTERLYISCQRIDFLQPPAWPALPDVFDFGNHFHNDEYCHIVNISSIAGTLGNPQMSGYNASKYGVRGFSQALFKELRYDKIKVTAMFPGSIATDFFKIAANQNSHSNMMHPDDVADTLIHILETPDNFLIDEIKLRPLNPKNPDER